jgi:toxin-antitoxin system PIN domain toxin
MIIIDTNLLIYSVNRDAPQYEAAHEWLEATISGTQTIGLAWIVILSFLRVTTMAHLFRRPLAIKDAVQTVENWLDQPGVAVVHPGQHHARILHGLLLKLGTGGNLTTDAHLAALAIEHNAELCSVDRDFARFPGLRWRDPLSRP